MAIKLTTTELRTLGGTTAMRVSETLESAVITKHGKPVAAIVPIEVLDLMDRSEVLEELRALRQARREVENGAYVTIEELRESLYGPKVRRSHPQKRRKANKSGSGTPKKTHRR